MRPANRAPEPPSPRGQEPKSTGRQACNPTPKYKSSVRRSSLAYRDWLIHGLTRVEITKVWHTWSELENVLDKQYLNTPQQFEGRLDIARLESLQIHKSISCMSPASRTLPEESIARARTVRRMPNDTMQGGPVLGASTRYDGFLDDRCH